MQFIQFQSRCCTYCFYARSSCNHVLQARNYGIRQKDQFARLKERIVETLCFSCIMWNQIVNHDPCVVCIIYSRAGRSLDSIIRVTLYRIARASSANLKPMHRVNVTGFSYSADLYINKQPSHKHYVLARHILNYRIDLTKLSLLYVPGRMIFSSQVCISWLIIRLDLRVRFVKKKRIKKKKLISLQYLETNGCVDPISLVILANIWICIKIKLQR